MVDPVSRGPQSTVVTYLEMLVPPSDMVWPKLPVGVEIHRAAVVPLRFYRYLYQSVGEAWHWTERLGLSDDQLRSMVQRDGIEMNVLYVDGVPSGYAELDFREPVDVQLAYFGLVPEAVGKRLGSLLLRWTVVHVWHRHPRRFWVHTCDLDHPRALPLYQEVGFRIFRTSTETVPTSRQA